MKDYGCIIHPLGEHPNKKDHYLAGMCNQTEIPLLYNHVPEKPTLLHVRGAMSGVLRRGDSLGVSEVELRDELLLKNSVLALLKLEVSWRKDSINSVGSLCPSRRGSCRCLCLRSLDMTCDSGMPNTWGISSVGGEKARQEDIKFIFLASSELGNVELLLIYISHVSI